MTDGAGLDGLRMALHGNRTNLKPSMRAMLAKVGTMPIRSIQVCRAPLASAISAIIGLVRNKNAAVAHDKLFHLFFIIDCGNGYRFCLQKNEDTDLIMYKPGKHDEIYPEVFMPPRAKWIGASFTINQMIANSMQYMGSSFFRYDAFTNNCQDFVYKTLLANGIIMNNQSRDFILQHVMNLAPSWAQKIAYGVTSLANRFKTAVSGAGPADTVIVHEYDSDDQRDIDMMI
jgi:hypothetical protein